MEKRNLFTPMCALYHRGLVLLLGILLPLLSFTAGITESLAQSSISFTTEKKVGEKVKLRIYIEPDTPIAIEGVEEEFENQWKEYTLTQQEVVITGQVTKFYCSNNLITSLNTSNAAELKDIICSYNKMKSLDFRNNKQITGIISSYGNLESIFLKGADKLKAIDCSNNNLKELDLTGNPELVDVTFSNNQLKKLDLSSNKLIKNLFVENNELKTLKIEGMEDLLYVNCFGNLIRGKAMTDLMNALPEKAYEEGASIRIINGKSERPDNHCMVSDVEIATEKFWEVQDYNGGKKIAYAGTNEAPPADETEEISLITSKNIGETLFINIQGEDIEFEGLQEGYQKGWQSYHLTEQTVKIKGKVTLLDCSISNLTSLDVTKAPSLLDLNCSSNQLTTLDLSQNVNLTDLDIFHNQLTQIDLSQNINLENAELSANKFTSLNFSNNSKLKRINIFFNSIKKDDMKQLIASLPHKEETQKGGIVVINSVPGGPPHNITEHNECWKEDVEVAKAKNWLVYDWKGGRKEEYSGYYKPEIGDGLITLRTKLNPGEKITLDLGVVEDIPATIEGIKETYEPGVGVRDYTLTAQELVIRGDITFFACYGNKIEYIKVQNPKLVTLQAFDNEIKEAEISPSPVLKRILLSNNKLTTLKVENCPSLESISLFKNELNEIVVADCPNLSYVDFFSNKINADKMAAFIAGLPTIPSEREKGMLLAVNTKAEPKEGNIFPSALVTTANTKNWEVRDYDGGSNGAQGVPFKGTDVANKSVESLRINCYPNPTTDQLFIEGATMNERIIIYALDGTILYQTRVNAPQMCIDMRQYPDGAYLVQVEEAVQKVVKQ